MAEPIVRKAFGEGLVHLNQTVVRMAALSQSAIHKAVEALIELDEAKAREIFAIDREIFRLQRLVESECTDLIALHAPVARDLRTITTVLKISTDLDRIGRGARNIAESTIELVPLGPTPPKKIEKLSRNADLAIHMVEQVIRAFVEQDDRSVRDMSMFDDAVDALYREIFDELVAAMQDRTMRPEVGARYVLVNRQIERIADHAVNIAERVTYLVSGEEPLKAKALALARPGAIVPPASSGEPSPAGAPAIPPYDTPASGTGNPPP